MFLIVALFFVGIKNTFDFGNIWWVTILTSSLFWSLTIYYLYKTLKNKTLPPTSRQPSNAGGFRRRAFTKPINYRGKQR
jgi:hypothetical protein